MNYYALSVKWKRVSSFNFCVDYESYQLKLARTLLGWAKILLSNSVVIPLCCHLFISFNIKCSTVFCCCSRFYWNIQTFDFKKLKFQIYRIPFIFKLATVCSDELIPLLKVALKTCVQFVRAIHLIAILLFLCSLVISPFS